MKVAVLGAGMAGLGAAYRLHVAGVRSAVFEKMPYHGGHAASFEVAQGFIFDDGPHISFTKDRRIQELFARSVGGDYRTIQARVNNYWRGYWIKHPAQCNLHGLPTDLVVQILREFVEVRQREPGEIRNYRDWLVNGFGRTFSETFPMRYGLKFHTTDAANMSTEWLGPRLYRPDLEEVLRGALSPETPEVHYIDHFRYPARGGFVSYLDMFAELADPRLDHEVVGVNPKSRELRLANGSVASYDALISSIPLPELVPMIDGTPADVTSAAERLACTNCVLVSLGLNRADLSETHWTYFYDDDYCFARLSFPHMLSPHNAPPGAGSIQAEIYHSKKYRPLNRPPDEWIEPVIGDLKRCGLLRENDEILVSDARYVPYANVIFDLERAEALRATHGYLDQLGIHCCGRYGEWGYHWTDESFISGERAAQRVLDGNPPDAAPREGR